MDGSSGVHPYAVTFPGACHPSARRAPVPKRDGSRSSSERSPSTANLPERKAFCPSAAPVATAGHTSAGALTTTSGPAAGPSRKEHVPSTRHTQNGCKSDLVFLRSSLTS